ncbi:beta-N-acetylhexosaminidase [Haloarcula sp. CBA1130]|uniref:beta-N-acetylhexosaminidase n=1 Tax=unclassified Haloarcula TaxID=2624677 RepID=UPI0012465F86|nr:MULTISPECIES: beta-N-acetylhexosaminidase [unclassified Haloarcula]KAA9396224.1 beta-N-acetylhexosaminidase [Haloarcula sp. CBA1129]KAA9400527.1 beta-N-acetylhexosaminidase [Haloarcula sp. CBA1130]
MPVAQKVGQLFMAGFEGPEPTDGVLELIREYNLGNIIYFTRNITSPAQVAALSAELQSEATAVGAGLPLFVATDQEGGVVSRLNWGTQLPSQMLIGACDDDAMARKAGATVGRELRSLGINLNLAPVLDVNNNPDNPVIGVRSFGEDPERVAALGTAMAQGLQSVDVAACGKHFPGHGDTAVDSHLDLPVVAHERPRLERVEFAPFEAAIQHGIDAIMTTHVAFPSITGDEELPATISSAVQTALLRKQLGFNGLLVTDCLEMDAIAEGVGPAEGAVRAIEAGCDIVTVSHTLERQRAAIEAVLSAVRSGRLTEERIDRSLHRIQRCKQRRVGESETIEVPEWRRCATASKQLATEIADCGVTLVRDDSETLPFDTSRPLHVVSFTGTRGSPAEDERYDPEVISAALREVGFDVRTQITTGDDTLDIEVKNEQLVAVSYDAVATESQAETLQRLIEHHDQLAVLAVRNPYDLSICPDAVTFLTTYDYSPGAIQAAAKTLAGIVEPTGTLPVTVPK